MDFLPIELSGSELELQNEVQAFIAEHITEEVHNLEWEFGDAHNQPLHKAMGAKGWLCPTWSKDEGGAGLTSWEASIIRRELAIMQAPMVTHGTTQLTLGAVMNHAKDEIKAEITAGVASGDICICLGYTEPDAGSDLASVRTKATRDGDEWIIDGQKMFTTGAHNCQYAFLVARSNPDLPRHKGITMFLCPLDEVEIQAVHTLSGERTNMVFFDGLRIHDKYRLGEIDRGWSVLMDPLNAEHGMGDRIGQEGAPETEIRGGMYGRPIVEGLRRAVLWAKTPDGTGARPIDDPHVRRRLARAELELEAMSTAPGPMGRIVSAEGFLRMSSDLMDLMGPEALVSHGEEGSVEEGWIDYCYRQAPGTAIYGGTTDIHRNIIAEQYLGLPRSSRA